MYAQHQAIVWTDADLLPTALFGWNFEIVKFGLQI